MTSSVPGRPNSTDGLTFLKMFSKFQLTKTRLSWSLQNIQHRRFVFFLGTFLFYWIYIIAPLINHILTFLNTKLTVFLFTLAPLSNHVRLDLLPPPGSSLFRCVHPQTKNHFPKTPLNESDPLYPEQEMVSISTFVLYGGRFRNFCFTVLYHFRLLQKKRIFHTLHDELETSSQKNQSRISLLIKPETEPKKKTVLAKPLQELAD